MIDLTKIRILNCNLPKLLNNPLLVFQYEGLTENAELVHTNKLGKKRTPYQWTTYKGLFIKVYDSGYTEVKGSLHKYWNDGKHNYNDFNSTDASKVINSLYENFNWSKEQCILKNVELGVNIEPSLKVREIIESCFLHSTMPFETKYDSEEGHYIQVKHSQYIVKIYDKGLHYRRKGFDINNNILRFEIKFLKMEKLNNLGIYTIDDLICYGLENFKELLLKEWDKILFFDPTTKFNNQTKYLKYSNPKYWKGLLDSNKMPCFNKNRKDLRTIMKKHSNDLHNQISHLISNKIDNLCYPKYIN